MSKTDVEYKFIDKSKVNKKKRKPNFVNKKKINGFDTETTPNGDIYVITRDLDVKEHVDIDYVEPDIRGKKLKTLSFERIIDFVTHKKCRNAINVWYNLSFDANAILKHLTKQKLDELNQFNETRYKDYKIKYFKGKYLGIIDKHNHRYEHYDVAQFFYTSLNNACETWLNENKKGIDTKTLETVNGILNNFNEILQYAKKDAKLVKDLWKKFVNEAENLGIPCGRPYSTGYLAQQTLENKLSRKITNLKPYQKYAWRSYYGGRFEVFKKGNVGNVIIPDINSAYPYVMSKLPAPSTLKWEKKNNVSMNDVKKSDYAIIKAEIETNPRKKAQPFAVKNKETNNKVKYPAISTKRYLIKPVLEYAYRNNYLQNYELINAYLGYEKPSTLYPFRFIKDMYKQRKKYEKNGEHKKGKVLKITLNSMYGKTIQTTLKREKKKKVREEMKQKNPNKPVDKLIPKNYISVPIEAMPESFKEKTIDLVEYLEAGSWFNPFLATYITSLTRLELLKAVDKYDLLENLVMFATDSVMIEENAFKKTNFRKNLVKKGLGNWGVEKTGKGLILASGIYEVCDENEKRDQRNKLGTRGFNEKNIRKRGGLKQLFKENENKEKIKIKTYRPRTYGEAVWGNVVKENIATFNTLEKEIRADMDEKRDWLHGKISFGHLLNESFDSLPLDHRTKRKDEILQSYERDKKELDPLKNIDLRQSIEDIGREALGDFFDPHIIDSTLTKKEQLNELRKYIKQDY